jgi:hypothetical protein
LHGAERQVAELANMNDPRGLYVLCACDAR